LVEQAEREAGRCAQNALYAARQEAEALLTAKRELALARAATLAGEAEESCRQLAEGAGQNLNEAVKFIRERLVRRDGAS